MAAADTPPRELLSDLLRRCLDQGLSVEVERLGVFRRGSPTGFSFVPETRASVFIAYAAEDRDPVDRLCDRLEAAGFDVWLDRRKLKPGQNWPRAIERAIQTADFFVACLSARSVVKRGAFQAEMRFALDCARRVPLDEIFFVPVRLEECRVPPRIEHQLQYVDVFPDFDRGVEQLATALKQEWARRRAA